MKAKVTDSDLQPFWHKLAQAEACWFSSVRPDGRVHSAPIWHVWHAGEIYVTSQTNAVRVANITHNPSVSITLPDAMNVLIVEGNAYFAPQAVVTLQPLFQAKYAWDIATDQAYRSIIAVTPRKLLAWGRDGEIRRRFAPRDPAQ